MGKMTWNRIQIIILILKTESQVNDLGVALDVKLQSTNSKSNQQSQIYTNRDTDVMLTLWKSLGYPTP